MTARLRTALGAGGRTVLLLSLVSLLTDISSDMTLNVLPIFLTGTLGVSVVAVGVIEGVGESASAATRLFSGRLSDRMPRRLPLVVGGYTLSALTKPLFALVTGPGLAGVLRFTDRLGKGVRSAPRDALIADVAVEGRRGLAFGIHRAADTVGALLGVLAAALVVRATGGGLSRGDFQRVVLVAMVPALLAVAVLGAVRERGAEQRSPSAASARASLLAAPGTTAERRYLFVVFLFALGNSSDAFLLLRLIDIGASVVGALLLMALMNGAYVVLAAPAGGLSDRFGRRRLLLAGYVAYAAIYAGLAGASSVAQALPLLALYGAYYGATEGITRAFVVDLAPSGARGGAFGWFHAVTALAALPASVIAGALWSAVGPGAAFAFGSACALAAAALLTTVRSAAGDSES